MLPLPLWSGGWGLTMDLRAVLCPWQSPGSPPGLTRGGTKQGSSLFWALISPYAVDSVQRQGENSDPWMAGVIWPFYNAL